MADNKTPAARPAAMAVDTALVRELADLLATSGLTEIEVEDGDRRIRVSRAAPAPAPAPTPLLGVAAPAAPAAAAAPAAPAAPAAAEPDLSKAVRSPMVGTAYLAAEPGSPPFVRPGTQVKAGDTLLIVEAMKVMNPITAPRAGTVQEILVGNAEPVEYDQPLVILV